jgi:hypothetical protein
MSLILIEYYGILICVVPGVVLLYGYSHHLARVCCIPLVVLAWILASPMTPAVHISGTPNIVSEPSINQEYTPFHTYYNDFSDVRLGIHAIVYPLGNPDESENPTDRLVIRVSAPLSLSLTTKSITDLCGGGDDPCPSWYDSFNRKAVINYTPSEPNAIVTFLPGTHSGEYLVSDSAYVWVIRVKPSISWWRILLLLLIVVVPVAWTENKSQQRRRSKVGTAASRGERQHQQTTDAVQSPDDC